MAPKLSIIILNYNTENLTRDCLNSLKKVENELDFEIIVSDNGSTDGSVAMIRKEFPNVMIVENKANLGFAKGNNQARKIAKGKYVLFLNTDTIVYPNTLRETVDYLENHKEIGALTCKVVLANGELDKDTRRAFPTPWVSFSHLVLPLDRIFTHSKLFAKYWYGYLPEDQEAEVDVIQGAFFLTPKKVLDRVGWFDEDYYLDGEDIDICWKIKVLGYKIIYHPEVSILHLKGATKGKNRATQHKVPLAARLRFRMSGVNSMEIFYKKRLWKHYPLIINLMVLAGIKALKFVRFIKVAFL
ncbi:glycosyltransferase family 2 protein [Patescibacteria group bacterium]|nr:glycosyltransferase family 2 protein [Patescibacteria group bacterium]